MRSKLEDHKKRIELARKSLDGLSLGDAFGQRFFGSPALARLFAIRFKKDPRRGYKDALWTTVAGLGDRDTTCALVGGIVASKNEIAIPADWLAARETFDIFRRGNGY